MGNGIFEVSSLTGGKGNSYFTAKEFTSGVNCQSGLFLSLQLVDTCREGLALIKCQYADCGKKYHQQQLRDYRLSEFQYQQDREYGRPNRHK